MRLFVLAVALLAGANALQLRSAPLTRATARRTTIPVACEAPETTDAEEGPGFTDGFLAAAGLFANPIAACSLYNVAATGSGLPAGPYDLLGALEGVSFLVVAGICVAALVSKVTKGSGLPAGPFGLLGLSEGLSFLSLFAALLVFPLKEFGIVGDPQTAAVDVPAATAAAAAFLAPLVAHLIVPQGRGHGAELVVSARALERRSSRGKRAPGRETKASKPQECARRLHGIFAKHSCRDVQRADFPES